MSAVETVLTALQQENAVSRNDVAHARSVAREMDDRPDRVMVRLGLVTEKRLHEAYRSALGLQKIDPAQTTNDGHC